MSFIGNFFYKKSSVKGEFPRLFETYELITSNDPNVQEDLQKNLKDEIFLQKFKLYSPEFRICFQEILAFRTDSHHNKQLLYQMQTTELKLQRKICAFATKKAQLINKVFPEILSLESLTKNLLEATRSL